MFWSIIHHFASAFQLRAELAIELSKARARGTIPPKKVYRWIWKEPHNHEEYIWLYKFFSSNEPVKLIDIGGNSGYWAESFLAYFPEAHVYGFEPVDEMYQSYYDRFNGRENVKIFHTALGNTNERREINVAGGYGLTSFNTYSEHLEDRNKNFTKRLAVNIKMLDDYVDVLHLSDQKRIIVKIDVQGFESKVVQGGMKVLLNADVLLIECSFVNEFKEQVPTFGELVTNLRALDFHPIRFGVYERKGSFIAYERNVLFVKSKYFADTWN